MDILSTILAWTCKALATWYVAGIVGGVLILITERCRAVPSRPMPT